MYFKVFLFLALFAAFSCHNQSEHPTTNLSVPATVEKEISDTAGLLLAQRYDAYFSREFTAQQGLGAAVAIVKDGKIILQKGYGFRNAHTRDSVDTHTVFRIGSLSKGFTGVLTGILDANHALSIHDKVVQWLPEFRLKDKEQTKRVEIAHLLSHTTGLPYHAYTNLVEEGYSLDKIVREYFYQSPVCGKEGEFYAYQNAAFSLTGTIMAKATGVPFAQLIQQKIFQPCNMLYASCDYASIDANPNKAVPHQWSGWNWVPGPIEDAYYNVAEAGGVNASISDMAQWLLLLTGERPAVASSEVLDKVFEPIVKTGKERRILGHWIDRDSASYALGWRILNKDGATIVYHSGYVNGFRGEIAFDRDLKTGICVLFNGQIPLSSACVPDFFEIAREILQTSGQ